jgi:hypothetical protein
MKLSKQAYADKYYPPARKTDKRIRYIMIVFIGCLAGAVVYINVGEARLVGDARERNTHEKNEPEIVSGNPQKGEIEIIHGTLIQAEGSAYPYYLDTGDRRIPLELSEGDRLLGQEIGMKVEYTGEGRKFTIVSITVRD